MSFFRRPLRDDPMAWILAVVAVVSLIWALSYLGQAVSLDINATWDGIGYSSHLFEGDAMNVTLQQNATGWDMVVEAMGWSRENA